MHFAKPTSRWLTGMRAALNSIGATLTDTLDDLITDTRIDPQLAMKILANFDRAIADVLQERVKARLTFKVRQPCCEATLVCLGNLEGWRGMRSGRNMADMEVSIRLQGSLDTYRFCDEVWTFLIKNVQFKMENGGQAVVADKVKIVSCNAKRPGEGQ